VWLEEKAVERIGWDERIVWTGIGWSKKMIVDVGVLVGLVWLEEKAVGRIGWNERIVWTRIGWGKKIVWTRIVWTRIVWTRMSLWASG
jgi:hypothetical protein